MPRYDKVLPPPTRPKQPVCISSSPQSAPPTGRRAFRTSTASTKSKRTSQKSESAQQFSRPWPSWRSCISLESSSLKGSTRRRSRRQGRSRKLRPRTLARSPFASLRTPVASQASASTSRATSSRGMTPSPSSRVSPGRPFSYYQVPLDVIRQRMGEDAVRMYEWFDRVGFAVDRATLRREFPDVAFHDFESWAKTRDWNALLQSA